LSTIKQTSMSEISQASVILLTQERVTGYVGERVNERVNERVSD